MPNIFAKPVSLAMQKRRKTLAVFTADNGDMGQKAARIRDDGRTESVRSNSE